MNPETAKLARRANLRLIAVGGQVLLFDRSTGQQLTAWVRSTGYLCVHGRRLPNAPDLAAVVALVTEAACVADGRSVS